MNTPEIISPYLAVFNGNLHNESFPDNAFTANQSCNYSEFEKNSIPKFVFINYDYKNKIEKLTSQNLSSLDFPESVVFEKENEISPEEIEKQFSKNYTGFSVDLNPTITKEKYIENVNLLKSNIRKGNIYEINYCITFEANKAIINPFEVYKKLNHINQSPFSAFIKMQDKFIICSSPELFLSKRANKLITKPIKGTARRSLNLEEDEKIKNELRQSLKERTENVMIVDVARNDLSRIARKGSVKVEKLYDIESFSQVHQMVSTVSCELKENISFKEIIHATFPMASMTGAPKIKAMELIDKIENYNRGPFSGTIGIINEKGDFDLNVLIRSIFYNETEKYLSFSVGSAITHLCDPEKEYEECLLKAAALIKALQE